MRAWFWTIVTITLAVVVAFLIHRFPGNVLIVVDQWRIQVSLAFAVLVLLAGFASVYLVFRFVSWLAAMPERYRGWRGQRRERQEQSLLEQGWIGLLEGRYSFALKALTRLSGQSGNAQRRVLAMLSAARAAQELGEFNRRDEMINAARQLAGGQSSDVGLNTAVAAAAAELWLQQGQAGQALDVLGADNVEANRHLHTMRLLMKAHDQLGNNDKVLELARVLRRKQAISDAQSDRLIEQAACAELRRRQATGDWEVFWKSLRTEEKVLPEVALAGSSAMQSTGQLKESTKVLENAIKVTFDPRLLIAYARAEPEQVNPRLQRAEQWLAARDKDPDLLASLGALCLAAQMWGQAQRYLERSLEVRNDPRVHALLGSLFDRIGQQPRAARHWRLATAVSAALPALAQDVVLPPADVEADPVIPQIDVLEDYLELNESPEAVRAEAARPSTSSASYDDLFDSAPIPVHHFESVDGEPVVRPTAASSDSKLAEEVSEVPEDSTAQVPGRGHLS
jgi:HemY protein